MYRCALTGVRKESTTIVLQAKGSGAGEKIDVYVKSALEWYKGALEAERDEKRYMFMMLHLPVKARSGGGSGGGEAQGVGGGKWVVRSWSGEQLGAASEMR